MKKLSNAAGFGGMASRCEYVVRLLRRGWHAGTPGTESSLIAGNQQGQLPLNYPDEGQHPCPVDDRVPNDRESPIVQTTMSVKAVQTW